MRIFKSRLLLGLIALLAGFMAGAAMIRYCDERAVNAQLPMQAYLQAIVAASLERGDLPEAKEQQRIQLRGTLHALAVRNDIYGGDLSRDGRVFRLLSTYYDKAPDPELDPAVKQFLQKYPGYSQQEIASGHCDSSICRLGKSAPSTQPGE